MDPAPLQPTEDLGVSLARVRGDGLDRGTGDLCCCLEASQNLLALVHLARGDLDVQHDPEDVVDHRVLLVGRLQTAVTPVGRHRGIGVGDADLLEPSGLLRAPPDIFGRGRNLGCSIAVRLGHRVHVPNGEALPAHVGPDQRGIHMDHLASGVIGPAILRESGL